MLFRSFLQLIALVLFFLVFLTVALLLAAFTGHLGEEARYWMQWVWQEATANRELIEKVFAFIGAVSTLTISALGVYKTWRFAEINLPLRLEELISRWHGAAIRQRPEIVPELALVDSIFSTLQPDRSLRRRFVSIFYDADQTALSRCSQRVDKFEKELRAIEKSKEHCRAEIQTGYLELGSLLRRCNPRNGHAALNLFKKQLENEPPDWDALELSARQAYSLGLHERARDYLAQLIGVTKNRACVRHARALRFHAEILRGGTSAERNLARVQLETAINVLKTCDSEELDVRKKELGLAYADLAEVHILSRRFRLARGAVADARRYGGPTDRLGDIESRATPQRGSDPPQPTDGPAKKEGDS